jgi:hypothetical protein
MPRPKWARRSPERARAPDPLNDRDEARQAAKLVCRHSIAKCCCVAKLIGCHAIAECRGVPELMGRCAVTESRGVAQIDVPIDHCCNLCCS